MLLEQKKLDSAQQFFEKSLNLSHHHNDKIGIIENQILLAKTKLARGLEKEALSDGLTAFELARSLQSKDEIKRSCKLLSDIYETTERFKESLEYHKLHELYQDSIISIENSKQLAALRIQFEVEKRESEIAILKQKNEIQALQVSRQRYLIWLFIIAALILSFILILLYYVFRLRQREKKQIEEKNRIISKSLEDKEHLIKEIHHRVKNNLQTIQSILDTQSIELKDQSAKAVLQDSKSRVETISLIHQYLYQNNAINLDIDIYASHLIKYLQNSIPPERSITIYQSIESIHIDADQAVSLGLIINEALTNALKHGFKDNESGEIYISLKRENNDEFLLEIADNGIGLPFDFKENLGKSMGFRLMKGLAEHLAGTLQVACTNGTILKFIFPVQKFRIKAA